MNKFIVITTVNEPSEAIEKFAHLPGWKVIVVGDEKTPKEWHNEDVKYLSLDDQKELFPVFSSQIPWNCYQRKNLGYLYAIREGADLIFESDDDNTPYEDFNSLVASLMAFKPGSLNRVSSVTNWANMYEYFGSCDCWPRGYPLQYIGTSAAGVGVGSNDWSVAQFLADRDPDVDAIYRLTNGDGTIFEEDRHFILDKNTFCPMNSQATLWKKEAFPLMFLPVGVPGRVTDILRGYIVQPCLWAMNRSAIFASPNVYQERNEHNLLKDFKEEIPLYLNADRWCKEIMHLAGNSMEANYFQAITRLIMVEALPYDNVDYYKLFLREMGDYYG